MPPTGNWQRKIRRSTSSTPPARWRRLPTKSTETRLCSGGTVGRDRRAGDSGGGHRRSVFFGTFFVALTKKARNGIPKIICYFKNECISDHMRLLSSRQLPAGRRNIRTHRPALHHINAMAQDHLLEPIDPLLRALGERLAGNGIQGNHIQLGRPAPFDEPRQLFRLFLTVIHPADQRVLEGEMVTAVAEDLAVAATPVRQLLQKIRRCTRHDLLALGLIRTVE